MVSDADAEYTVILHDGTEYPAKVLALDPVNDLAVIQVQPTDTTFTPLKIAQEADIHI